MNSAVNKESDAVYAVNDMNNESAASKPADLETGVREVAAEETEKPKRFAFLRTKEFWVALVLGQYLSWCLVGTNTLVTYMSFAGNQTPAFESFLNYALLFSVYTPYTIYKKGFKSWFNLIKTRGWKFALWAFVDVEGNYFVVKAYSYTTLLSAELLDAWAVVAVVILSFFFLKVRYHWTQLLGIVICLLGLGLLVASDAKTGKDYPAASKIKGDLFMILGATFYGVSNTFEEYVVSKISLYEVLGQLGMYGMVINGCQVAIFERHAMQKAVWTGKIGGYLVGYNLILFSLYSTAPILFRMTSAVFFNLSLLTSDFWGLIIGTKLFHFYVYWLYPIAFVCVIVGLVIYYTVVRTVAGEAKKPWLGENQEQGISGIGTYKRQLELRQASE